MASPNANVDTDTHQWEDQGLYFTLIYCSILFAVLSIVAYLVHRKRKFWRVLRPNRPGSRMATFFFLPKGLGHIHEYPVLRTVGVTPMIYALLLKYFALIFLGIVLTSAGIVALCATDDYLNRNRQESDPDQCGDFDADECGKTIKCYLHPQPVTIHGRTARCQPAIRHGLFDFSVTNMQPDSWRWYLFGIFCALASVPIALITIAVVHNLAKVIRASYIIPVFNGLAFAGLASVGARTVLIGGLPKDATLLTDRQKFLEYLYADSETKKGLLADRLPSDFSFRGLFTKKRTEQQDPHEPTANNNGSPLPLTETSVPYLNARAPAASQSTVDKVSGEQAELGPQTNVMHDCLYAQRELEREESERWEFAPHPRRPVLRSRSGLSLAERSGPRGAPADVSQPSWEIAMNRAVLSTLVLVREAPKKLIDLIAEEQKTAQNLVDAVAAEQFETDPANKPVKKRLIPQFWKQVPAVEHEKKELAKIREKLATELEKREDQGMAGAAIITFDRASSAYAFVEQYNKEQGRLGDARATILGAREGVIWENLGIPRKVEMSRKFIMIALFTALVFLWGIPVAILGNLDRLQTLPGIGGPIGSSVNAMPAVVSSTLASVLPVIAITLFNILLPIILRFFAAFSGVKTADARNRLVLLMGAIFAIMSGIVIQAALQGGFIQIIDLISDPSGQAVMELIIAIVSPMGGYWFTYLLSAAVIGLMLRLLVIGPLIVSTILGKLAKGRQQEYDRLFLPRQIDYAYVSGRHIFFGAIGLFFHGTVAFVQPFAVIYTVLAYMVERSVLVDGCAADTLNIVNYSFAKTYLHSILALHTVAAVGNVLVAALKESIGGAIIAAIALAVNIVLHVYAHRKLSPLVYPSKELIVQLETEMDTIGLAREQVEDVASYVPEYAEYEIDPQAVRRIESAEYKQVDKSWPRNGTVLQQDDPHGCCQPAPMDQEGNHQGKFPDCRIETLKQEHAEWDRNFGGGAATPDRPAHLDGHFHG